MNELWITKPYAALKMVKKHEHTKTGAVRTYRSSPTEITMQIWPATKPGALRAHVASVSLTLEEARELAHHLNLLVKDEQ